MAVPGHPADPRAAGCNILIRDGATLVRSGADVAEALGWCDGDRAPKPAGASAEAPTPLLPDALSGRLMNALGPAPVSEDALMRDLGAPPDAVLAALSELHLDGRIERHAGGLVSRRVA
jgi:DNA processing protein